MTRARPLNFARKVGETSLEERTPTRARLDSRGAPAPVQNTIDRCTQTKTTEIYTSVSINTQVGVRGHLRGLVPHQALAVLPSAHSASKKDRGTVPARDDLDDGSSSQEPQDTRESLDL